MADAIEYDPDNDYFAILNVSPRMSVENIVAASKRAHKKLVLKLHPDKHPVGARKYFHIPFTRIQNAYEVFGDREEAGLYYINRKFHYERLFKSSRLERCYGFHCWIAEQHAINLANESARIDFLDKKSEEYKKGEREQQKREKAQEQRQRNEHDKRQKERQAELKRRREQERREKEEAERQKKQRDENRRREKEEAERQKKQRDEERKIDKEIIIEEMAEVKLEFEVWNLRQKRNREKEVEDREGALRRLEQTKENVIRGLKDAMDAKIEALKEKFVSQKEKVDEQYKRDISKKMAYHEKERETQRTERKRVRDGYKSWCEEMQSIVEGNEPSPETAPKRPKFYRPFFGRKKDGLHCLNCKKAGGFCSVHKDQKWD